MVVLVSIHVVSLYLWWRLGRPELGVEVVLVGGRAIGGVSHIVIGLVACRHVLGVVPSGLRGGGNKRCTVREKG